MADDEKIAAVMELKSRFDAGNAALKQVCDDGDERGVEGHEEVCVLGVSF